MSSKIIYFKIDPRKCNRSMRALLEKEVTKVKKLEVIEKALWAALGDDTILDFPLILGYYDELFKIECQRLNHFNNFKIIVLNPNYLEEIYGYKTGVVVKKYKPSIKILEPIRKFINRFN